jgi:site-specific recombinase XerD
LEAQRHNHIRTRNARLAALRSWVHYLADILGPDLPASTRLILAIPSKRYTQRMLGFLHRDPIQALLAVTDQSWTGQRDHLLFLLLYNTGARVSEITGLRVRDGSLLGGAHVELQGKGRKHRTVPLWAVTRRRVRRGIRTNRWSPEGPLLPNRLGEPLTRWGVAGQLRRLIRRAQLQCPSLKNQAVSPHTLRHSTARHLLQSGVAPEVIALWLGHESPNTTHLYVEADLEMKPRALDKMKPPNQRSQRFKPTDKLIRFLESL